MIIIKNKFGNVALNLEKNITVKISGGFDSAVLLYILASEIKKNNSKTTIHPLNVQKVGNEKGEHDLDKFDPTNTVNGIISFVNKAFPTVEIKPLRTRKVTNWWNDDKEYLNAHAILVTDVSNSLKNLKMVDYSGVTKNPSAVIGQEIFEETDNDGNIVKVHRNPERHRDEIEVPFIKGTVSTVATYKNIVFMNPFRNADKRLTMSLASKYNILDFLLKNTRSCEGRRGRTENFTSNCVGDYKCWWCHEREWALNNYDK